MKRYCFYCGKSYQINPMQKLGGLKAKVFHNPNCATKHRIELAKERILRTLKK